MIISKKKLEQKIREAQDEAYREHLREESQKETYREVGEIRSLCYKDLSEFEDHFRREFDGHFRREFDGLQKLVIELKGRLDYLQDELGIYKPYTDRKEQDACRCV